VAAGYSSGPTEVAFRWTASGGREDVGFEAGFAPTSTAFAISGDASTLVGRAGPYTESRAFRWRGPGTYQDLGLIPGATRAFAQGVSGDGEVVAGRAEAGSIGLPAGMAVRWTQATGMQGLGYTRPGHNYSEAAAISRDSTTIVGHSKSAGNYDAFVWREGTGMQILSPLAGPAPASFAFGVNHDGSFIVGQSGPSAIATMWTDGQPSNLATGSTWHSSRARAVNDDGTVVAGMLMRTSTSQQEAGVWTPARGFEPLADFLLLHGVALPEGWSLWDCFAVSADGQTFAGAARSSSAQQGFVVTIPCPASVMPMAAAVGVLAVRRRRTLA